MAGKGLSLRTFIDSQESTFMKSLSGAQTQLKSVQAMRGKTCEEFMAFAHSTFQHMPRIPGHALGVFAIFVFACGFPAAEHLLGIWDPAFLVFFRIGIVTLLMLGLWHLIEGRYAIMQAAWAKGIRIGFLGFGAGTFLLLYAQSLSDPVTVVLMAATMPVIGVAIEVLFDGRKLSSRFVVAVILVVIGGLVATGVNLSDGQVGLGALLALTATILFTDASRRTVRNLQNTTILGQTTITFFGGALFCAMIYGALRLSDQVGAPDLQLSPMSWAAFGLYSLGAMGVSQFLWLSAVRKLGIGIAGFHTNAAPIYVMVILLAFGGAFEITSVWGAALLLMGVVIAQIDDGRNGRGIQAS